MCSLRRKWPVREEGVWAVMPGMIADFLGGALALQRLDTHQGLKFLGEREGPGGGAENRDENCARTQRI
jgi:hypothetical protein